MASGDSQSAIEINRFLLAIRQSLESTSASSVFRRDARVLRSAYRQIDDLRFNFNFERRKNVGRAGKNWSAIFRTLVDDLDKLNSDGEFRLTSSRLPFKYFSFGSATLRGPALLGRDLPHDMAVYDASISLSLIIKDVLVLDRYSDDMQGGLPLRRIVPSPRIAPVHFDVVNDQVVIVPAKTVPSPADEENAASARNDLLGRGDRIVDELAHSNYDRRLIDSIKDVQSILSADENVVELGISLISCAGLCAAVKAEMPDSLFAVVNSYVLGVGMYISQFPDWRRFTENASTVNLEPSLIEELYDAAGGVIDKLRAQPALSEPEVPQVISRIRELIADPGKSSRRSAFALLRTLENLFISIYNYSAEFLDQTAQKTVSALSTATSKVIVSGLVLFAVSAMSPLSAVIARIPEASWMITAAEYVQSHLLK